MGAMSLRPLLVTGLALTTACATPPDVEPAAKCAAGFCGGNSPEVDHYGLHDLNVDHVPNAGGFVLLGTSLGGTFYDLEVHNSAFVAIDDRGGELRGGDLAGAVLWLARGKEQYGVVIAGVGKANDVVPPHDGLETYVLEWDLVVGRELKGPVRAGDASVEVPALLGKAKSVCPDPGPWDFAEYEWNEATAIAPYESVVFEGDRIDTDARTVDPQVDDRWFNLGCGRHTLAKLRLTRNTMHTVQSGAWQQVQATLKFLSADYCGTGTAFTVAGEPIVWRNDVGMTFNAIPTGTEARWNERGAICLDEPRLATTNLAAAQAQFPDIEAAIAAECPRPPPCPERDLDSFAFPDELITSGNY